MAGRLRHPLARAVDEGRGLGACRRARAQLAFAVDDLIACYRRGVFPMADARQDERIFLVDPARRGVIPLDRLPCAAAARPNGARGPLHRPRRHRLRGGDRGLRRIETRPDGDLDQRADPGALRRALRSRTRPQRRVLATTRRLVGGLYGVAIGAAFFGESMFSIERDASKVALTHLVARLIVGGYQLLDTQFLTEPSGAVRSAGNSARPVPQAADPSGGRGRRLLQNAGLRAGRVGFAGDQPSVVDRVLKGVERRASWRTSTRGTPDGAAAAACRPAEWAGSRSRRSWPHR